MRSLIIICGALAALTLAGETLAAEDGQQQQAGPTPEQQRLQRVYQIRMRYDQERAQADAQARANVRLVTQGGRGLNRGVDSPTVTGLRQRTNQQLARFENQFRCLDVDLEGTTGNTVVICGDNSGDIDGTNISADRDIVTVQGGTP